MLIRIIFFILLFTLTESTFAKFKQYPLCQSPDFDCMRIKSSQSWYSLFPDPTDRGIVMRLNRMNGELYAGKVIAIPKNLAAADLLDFSPLPLNIPAPGEKIILIDLAKHAFGAYEAEGALIRWGPATGGTDYCEDIDEACRTKSGRFRIYSVGNSNCISTKFPLPDGGAPMPYCMFFNGGQALHGSPGGVVKANVSHGCIRLFVQDAEWLRYDFVEQPLPQNKFRGTQVIVLPY